MDTSPKAVFSKPKLKSKYCLDDNTNVPLYVGAVALFVSVVTVVFFYREIKKLKADIGDIKQLKTQISSIDKRFDLIDDSIEEIVKILKDPQRDPQRNQSKDINDPPRDQSKDLNDTPKDQPKDKPKDQQMDPPSDQSEDQSEDPPKDEPEVVEADSDSEYEEE